MIFSRSFTYFEWSNVIENATVERSIRSSFWVTLKLNLWVLEQWHKVINIRAVGTIFLVYISELKKGTEKYIPGSYRLRIIYIN